MIINLELSNERELKLLELALISAAENQDKFGEDEDGDYELLDHLIEQVEFALDLGNEIC